MDPVTLGLGAAVLVIVALILVLVFYQAPAPRRAPRGVAAAFHRMLVGDHEMARDILAECIRDPQAPPEAFLHLGNLLREAGKPDRALSLHRGILARPTIEAEMRRLVEVAIADDLLALGQEAEAQTRLARLEQHFIDEALLQRRALALHRLGRSEEAAEVWQRRARLDAHPEHARQAARYLAELGREKQLAGHADMARRWTARARDLAPEVATAHAVEGDAYLADGDAPKAFQLWMEGLERGEEGRDAILPRLLELALRLGKVDAWLEKLERARAQRPDDPLLWRAVTDLRLRRGDREPFFALVESAPAPDATPLSTWAGWMRYLQGREDEAGMRRLLDAMPDALGPRTWVCRHCGHEESEARRACFACGQADPLEVAPEEVSAPAISDASGPSMSGRELPRPRLRLQGRVS